MPINIQDLSLQLQEREFTLQELGWISLVQKRFEAYQEEMKIVVVEHLSVFCKL
jgi:hypothetical protein